MRARQCSLVALVVHVLLYITCLCAGVVKSLNEQECEYYLAESRVHGFGRGVFAGQWLSQNETLFESSTILVRNVMAMETMLAYYVYTDENEDYEIMMFGPMLMLNHADQETVDYTFSDSPVAPPSQLKHAPFSTHTPFETFSVTSIPRGAELFTNYGQQWFKDRVIKRQKLSFNTPTSYTIDQLKNEGFCLTDIEVGLSPIPFAGKGVFAKKSFTKGDVVSVTPVLVLPLHALEMEADYSVLINYCITSFDRAPLGDKYANKSDVALLPLGTAGMINHGAGRTANVEMDWYDWYSDDRVSSWTASRLEEAKSAPLDIQYIATRNIDEGEEILISYGQEWEQTWAEYLDSMIELHQTLRILENKERDILDFDIVPPQFRASIGAPSGMFPHSFYVDECLGIIPCDILRGERNNRMIRERHNIDEFQAIMKAKGNIKRHAKAVGGLPSADVDAISNKEL